MTDTVHAKPSPGLDLFLGVGLQVMSIVFVGRMIIDTGTRMVYPFIPQISEGLGLSVIAFSQLIFIKTIAGVISPLFGLLSDKYGRRKLMALGLMAQSVGVIGLVILETPLTPLAMVVFGLGLTAYIPTQQSYISDLVPYQKRGRALAAIEISWAVTAILILPLVGWMIDTFGWRSPFVVVGIFSLLGAGMIWRQLPGVDHRSHTGLSWAETRAVFFRGNVLAAIGVSFLVFVAVGAFLGVWGLWFTAEFALEARFLGLVATAIGLAEGGGSILSSLIIDRVGKRRGSMLSLLLTALALLLLPLTHSNLPLAILGLIVIGFFLEFTIVSLIPLYSEQVPHARATVLSLALVGTATGGALGTPLAATLWAQSGLDVICAVMAGCLALASGLAWRFLLETS